MTDLEAIELVDGEGSVSWDQLKEAYQVIKERGLEDHISIMAKTILADLSKEGFV